METRYLGYYYFKPVGVVAPPTSLVPAPKKRKCMEWLKFKWCHTVKIEEINTKPSFLIVML